MSTEPNYLEILKRQEEVSREIADRTKEAITYLEDGEIVDGQLENSFKQILACRQEYDELVTESRDKLNLV